MKSSNQLIAVCLAAGFALVWESQAGAVTDNLTLSATPSVNLYDVYFFYSSASPVSATYTPLGNLTGGVDNTINFSALQPVGDPSTFVYSLIGVYDVGNQLVTVGVNSAKAASLTANPVSFSSAFGSPWTEAQVATAVMNDGTVTLNRFFLSAPNYAATTSPLGVSGEFFNFSTASPGGVFTVLASPEPGTMALFGLGAAALLCVGRSRRR